MSRGAQDETQDLSHGAIELFDQLQRLPWGNWAQTYGENMGQGDFERGIKRELGGARGFRNLVVYPEQIRESDGSTRTVHFVDTLPKTPSGKVRRFILRQQV